MRKVHASKISMAWTNHMLVAGDASRLCIMVVIILHLPCVHLCIGYTLLVAHAAERLLCMTVSVRDTAEVAADHGLDIACMRPQPARQWHSTASRFAFRNSALIHHPVSALSLCIPAQAGWQVLEKIALAAASRLLHG